MQSLINDRIITKYKYTSLADMTTSNQYNFYGIVIDSSFPSNNTLPESHYECILKVIDISYTHSSPIILTLIIKSRSKNQIPYIHKIGDVIRIINGTFKPKSKVYLNLLNESVALGLINGANKVMIGNFEFIVKNGKIVTSIDK